MSLPLLVTGTIGIDTIITPRGRAEGVLGGSVSFAAVAALLFTDRVDAVSIIGEDFPVHYEEALAAKGLCMDGVERKKGPSFAWTGEYFDNMNKRRTVCANDSVMLDWQVNVPDALRGHPVLVCCCMVPAQQLKCMEQCPDASLVLSDSMDKWLRRQPELLDAVISRSHITMMNEDEAKEYAAASTVLEAGEFLLSRGASYAVVKQGEYGAHPHRPRGGRPDQDFPLPGLPPENAGGPHRGRGHVPGRAGGLSVHPAGGPALLRAREARHCVRHGGRLLHVRILFRGRPAFHDSGNVPQTPGGIHGNVQHACRMQFMDLMFPAMKNPGAGRRAGAAEMKSIRRKRPVTCPEGRI